MPQETRERCRALYRSGKFDAVQAENCLRFSPASLDSISPASFSELPADLPSLASIRKYRGDAVQKALIYQALTDCVEFFNVGKGMSDKQVEMTVDLIASEFYFITPADLKLAFRMAITGKFGELYDRLDGSIVLNWLRLYFEQKAEYVSHDRVTKNNNLKSQGVSKEVLGMVEQKAKAINEGLKRKRLSDPFFARPEFIAYCKDNNPTDVLLDLADAWDEEHYERGINMNLIDFYKMKFTQICQSLKSGKQNSAASSE